MSTEPAAGTWRDARTQEIREQERGLFWLVHSIHYGLRVCYTNWPFDGFCFKDSDGLTIMIPREHIVKYARIKLSNP